MLRGWKGVWKPDLELGECAIAVVCEHSIGRRPYVEQRLTTFKRNSGIAVARIEVDPSVVVKVRKRCNAGASSIVNP